MSRRRDLQLQEASSSQSAEPTDVTPATPRTIRRVVKKQFLEQRPTSQSVQEPPSSLEGDGEERQPIIHEVRTKRPEPIAKRNGVRSVAGEVLNAEGPPEERKSIARSKRETSVISYYAQMSPRAEEVEPMPEIQYGEAIEYTGENALVRYNGAPNAMVPYGGAEESENAVVLYNGSTENAVVRYGEPTETAMVRFGEGGETAVVPHQANGAIEPSRANVAEREGTSQQPQNVVNYFYVYNNTVINQGTPNDNDESDNTRTNTAAESTEYDSRSRARQTSDDAPNNASSAPNVFNTNYVNNGNVNNGNINTTTNSQSNAWHNPKTMNIYESRDDPLGSRAGPNGSRDDPLGSRAGPNGSPDTASRSQARGEASRKNSDNATQADSSPRVDTPSREKTTAAPGGTASRRGSRAGSRPNSDAIHKDTLSRGSTVPRGSTVSRESVASRKDTSDTASRRDASSPREDTTSRNGATVGSRSTSNSQEDSFAGSGTAAPRDARPKNGIIASRSNEESDSHKTATPDYSHKNATPDYSHKNATSENKSQHRDSFNPEALINNIFALQSETNTSSTANTATDSSTESNAHNNVQIESSSDARRVYHIDNSVNNYYVMPEPNATFTGAAHARNATALSPFTNATGDPLPEMRQITQDSTNGLRRLGENNAHDDRNPLSRGPSVVPRLTANEPRPGSEKLPSDSKERSSGSGKLPYDSKERSSGSTSHASDFKRHSRSRSRAGSSSQSVDVLSPPMPHFNAAQQASGSATNAAQNEKLSRSGAVLQGSQSDSQTGSSTPHRGDSLPGSSTSRHGTTNDSLSGSNMSRNGATNDSSSGSNTSRGDTTNDSSSRSKGSFGDTKSESSSKNEKTRDTSKGGGLFTKKNKAAKESRPTQAVDTRGSPQGYDAPDIRVAIEGDPTERQRHSDPEPTMYDGGRDNRRRDAVNRNKRGRSFRRLCTPFKWLAILFWWWLPCCWRFRRPKSEDDTLPLTNPDEEKKRRKKEKKEKKKKKRRCCLIILIIIILLLLGNMIALDVDRHGKAANEKKNSDSAASDGVDGSDGTDGNSERSIKSFVCVSLLSAFATDLSQFPCGFCTSDPNAFRNVTEFCVLKGFWANASNRTRLEADFGWMRNSPFCDWNGVTCNDEDQITAIELKFPFSPIALPSDVGELKSLEKLEIVGNGNVPNGRIPAGLFELPSLKSLRLESTTVEGPLPDTFDKMTSLEDLFLVDNRNLGEIPPSIGSISLKNLVMNKQRITGDIPAFIGDSKPLQSSLEQLDLSFNNFTGGTPRSLSQLNSLTTLILSNNQLSNADSPFPKSLSTLDLSFNRFSGEIPTSITDLRNLLSLRIQNNGFSERIPTAIARNSGLEELLLNNNELTGAIPDELGDLRLQRLNLASNELTGAVPTSICRNQYRVCDLSNNSLTTRQCSDCKL